MGIIHTLPNPAVELVVRHSPQPHLAIDAGVLGGADDAVGDFDADVADAGEGRVEGALIALGGQEGGGEGGGGGVDHGLGDGGGFAEDGAEADAGEDVHVVACCGRGGELGGWVRGVGRREGVGREGVGS